jgi:hypothetical protein
MFLKRRVAAFGAVIVTLTCAPAALASAATAAPPDPVVMGPSCPAGYNGPTNLATGCPYWLMTYTVQYPGQPPQRCPAGWTPPPAGTRVEGCGVAPTAM